ncbi:hypothetical protein F4804DRAFT_305234 [Jackrogersella minutella]|nr:hypothetical protein F4804DRAFT_305234 [Jackrogersella minutella]
MSLGIKLLWRARIFPVRVGRLSPIPRELYSPLFSQRPSSQRWLSTSMKEMETSPTETEADEGAITDQPTQGKSRSPQFRDLYKRIMKVRSDRLPKEPVLVKRAIRHSNKRKSYRSLRKHNRSAAVQRFNEIILDVTKGPDRHEINWRSTIDFMLRYTQNVEEIVQFWIVIGNSVADEAREILKQPDTCLISICRRNETRCVQIEKNVLRRDELIFNISGSEASVQKSIQDIIAVLGKITAFRIPAPGWETLLLDAWKAAKRPDVQFLNHGEASADDKTMTVQTSLSTSTNSRHYLLTRRADEILRPVMWTKISFERYVAGLVYGRVPNYLARSLYPEFPDHQATVASILVDLFTSEETKSAISLSAMKMAVGFLESKGRGFQHEAWKIFDHVKLLGIPLDAEIYNIFLTSASRAKDLDAFNRVLRSMVWKGFHPQSTAWVAFLKMVESPEVKRHVVLQLRAKGLDRNPVILRKVGGEMARIDLEYALLSNIDMHTFLDMQDKKYGDRWLDLFTLNGLLELLGEYDRLDACHVVLDRVYETKRPMPDASTLNTMLTHTNFAPQLTVLASMMTRWPELVPDEVTYNILFRAAWKRRYPNMLRVVWRYAALSHNTNSRMRFTLTSLLYLYTKKKTSKRQSIAKEWESVIFGLRELSAMRRTYGHKISTRHFITHYLEQAGERKPKVDLVTKIAEAVKMDMEIHRILSKDPDVVIDKRMYTVDIPLSELPKPKPTTEPIFYIGIGGLRTLEKPLSSPVNKE